MRALHVLVSLSSAFASLQPQNFTDRTKLLTARDMWCADATSAMAIYGPIQDWDISRVNDLSYLFCADTPASPPSNPPWSAASCFSDIIHGEVWGSSRISGASFTTLAEAMQECVSTYAATCSAIVAWNPNTANVFYELRQGPNLHKRRNDADTHRVIGGVGSCNLPPPSPPMPPAPPEQSKNDCNANCASFNEAIGSWRISHVTSIEVRMLQRALSRANHAGPHR